MNAHIFPQTFTKYIAMRKSVGSVARLPHPARACRKTVALLMRMTILAPFFLAMLSGCGFFSKSFDQSPPPEKAQKVVKSAYSQMGKNYRSGGSSPAKGFDCSGLIWWAYRENGIKVPRITTDQAKSGESVSKRDARAGDIVVFRLSQSPRGLHTGLYAGGGAFIHSPRKGEKVRMESLNVPYWQSKLIAVRRVLN